MRVNESKTPSHPTPVLPQSRRTLSPARRQLLTLLQQINFGRIEQLRVRGGEPVLNPTPHKVIEYKFAGENGSRPEAGLADFPLKEQHLDLLRLLDQIGDGTIAVLSVKHGLPFHAELSG